jgi:hypothetical protein
MEAVCSSKISVCSYRCMQHSVPEISYICHQKWNISYSSLQLNILNLNKLVAMAVHSASCYPVNLLLDETVYIFSVEEFQYFHEDKIWEDFLQFGLLSNITD